MTTVGLNVYLEERRWHEAFHIVEGGVESKLLFKTTSLLPPISHFQLDPFNLNSDISIFFYFKLKTTSLGFVPVISNSCFLDLFSPAGLTLVRFNCSLCITLFFLPIKFTPFTCSNAMFPCFLERFDHHCPWVSIEWINFQNLPKHNLQLVPYHFKHSVLFMNFCCLLKQWPMTWSSVC